MIVFKYLHKVRYVEKIFICPVLGKFSVVSQIDEGQQTTYLGSLPSESLPYRETRVPRENDAPSDQMNGLPIY